MKLIKRVLIWLRIIKPFVLTTDNVIKLIESIPENKWTISVIENNGKCCFLGHLSNALCITPKNTEQVLQIPEIAKFDAKITQFVRNVHLKKNCSFLYY